MEDAEEYYKECTQVLKEQKSCAKSEPVENGSEPIGVKLSQKRAPADDCDAGVPQKQAKMEDYPLLSGMKFPRNVSLMKLLTTRADEVADLVKDVEQKHPKLISQQLPRHMRRRAVSHDKRRLPKRLKDKLAHEADPPKSKRPSRKHRRRPRNLLAEYARRQRRHVWLETHIWHAKRFRMAELWGYKIPVSPCDKGIRAAYRSTARHVLLHDLSYYNCIELMGKTEDLLEKLALVTSSGTGLTFKARAYLSGTQEGSTVLYRRGRYPLGAIGPVRFTWRPVEAADDRGTTSRGRQLWIWVHPSIHAEVTEELIGLFELQKVESGVASELEAAATTEAARTEIEDGRHKGKTKKKAGVKDSEEKPIDVPTHFERTPLYSGEKVSMVLLKDNLVRFSLTGPSSGAMLTAALLPAEVEVPGNSSEDLWWKTYYRETSKKMQDELWDSMKKKALHASALPRGCVLGQVVRDPRLLLPKTRTKVVDEPPSDETSRQQAPASLDLDPELSDSPIWNPAVRDKVTFTKMPESQLNLLRSQNVLPGTPIDLGDGESRIPILAVRRAGSRDSRGFGQGWDIVLPSGWARPFWIALIYRGARAAGLRELRSTKLEMGVPCFPFDHPDTKASQAYEEENRKELVAKHYRYPPDKRPSFQKLGVLCPFFFPWSQLLREWSATRAHPKVADAASEKDSPFFVLRDKKILRAIGHAFGLLAAKKPVSVDAAVQKVHAITADAKLDTSRALVAVQLRSTTKGVPRRFDFICAPGEGDEDAFSGSSTLVVEKLRKTAKRQKKDKKAAKVPQEELLRKPEVENLIDHCSRRLLGFVVSGDYCFSVARGQAVGYCSLLGLFSLVETLSKWRTGAVVMYRHQHSLQYRFARLSILDS